MVHTMHMVQVSEQVCVFVIRPKPPRCVSVHIGRLPQVPLSSRFKAKQTKYPRHSITDVSDTSEEEGHPTLACSICWPSSSASLTIILIDLSTCQVAAGAGRGMGGHDGGWRGGHAPWGAMWAMHG